MVEDYRLLRQAQLEYAEGAHNRDEDYRLVTFKDWLRAYQWEQPPETQALAIPKQGGSTSPIDAARRAVAAIPDPTEVHAEVDTAQPLVCEAVDEEGRCRV
jgi:hypothetical protein